MKAHLLAAMLLGAGLGLGITPSDASDEKPVETTEALPRGTGFDFYVLSLSWSPSYCAAEGRHANRQQCGGRPYAFVVHGLWPQYERGYPQDCRSSEPLDIPRRTLESLYDIMPSAGLIRHEWRTHGACTGLSQDDYFDVLRAARERIAIPHEFRSLAGYRSVAPDAAEAAFVAANPGLEANEMAVTCDRRYLREVRICLTKGLDFRACPEVDRKSCRLDRALMPPVRGR